MNEPRLNPVLLNKLANKAGKKEKYIREQIAKRANKLGISSEAALIIWAKQMGIGTGTYQRKLSPIIQTEVRDSLPTMFSPQPNQPSLNTRRKPRKSKESTLGYTIEWMINDHGLLDRCKDLLKARGNFDRAFREATTVLEDRIRKLSGVKGMRPGDLVSRVISPDPLKAILKVSDEAFEQQGFHEICKGLMLAFRDTTHHQLSDKFQRQDALKFCGFIDSILAILGGAAKQEAK